MKKRLTLIELIFFIVIFGIIAISLISRLAEKRELEDKKALKEYYKREFNTSTPSNKEIFLKMNKLLEEDR